MKKLLMGLGLIALLAGCASNDNGMGGTSDTDVNRSSQSSSTDSMKTDTFNQKDSSATGDQFHNNAVNGTGSSTATNSNDTSTSQP